MNAAGIDPDGPLSLEDLRYLPTMDKQDALVHSDQMVRHDVPDGAFKYNTGGSSGQPLIFSTTVADTRPRMLPITPEIRELRC